MNSFVSQKQATGPLLTREQAAEYIGVAVQTLALWASTGRYSLPFIRVGRHVRYRKSELEKWLEKQTVRHGEIA